jgi:hypothetical protein
VLFGGCCNNFADTWTWEGTDWTQRALASITLTPRSGPPGTVMQVLGSGFAAGEKVKLSFVDSTQGNTFLKNVQTDATGAFITSVTIPLDATPGRQHVKAQGLRSGAMAKRSFTVT